MSVLGETRRRIHALALAAAVAVACGGSQTGDHAPPLGDDDASIGGDDAGSGDDSSLASNATAVVVNGGPAGAESSDVPFISVTLCVPGTSTCKTIDYVSVDTGSSGFRVIASVLGGSLSLPQVSASTGNPLVECFQFEDGYTWGSVRTADLKIGGEIAGSIPIHLIGDPSFSSVPADCSSSGPSEDTVATFGGNGILGINQLIPDCGDYCSDASNPGTGAYYSCNGTACTAVAVPVAAQVSNPIASFSTDNNGALLTFPSVPEAGAATLEGTLVFGVGTQSNNGLGSATVQTLDADGNFTTVFNGATLTGSYVDSGTSLLSFNDSALTLCSGDLGYLYCPASPTTLSAVNRGINGATTDVTFEVDSASTLYQNASYTVFDDLAGQGEDGSFAWGFPFFIGRSVFIGLDGKSTPGGDGPFVAY